MSRLNYGPLDNFGPEDNDPGTAFITHNVDDTITIKVRSSGDRVFSDIEMPLAEWLKLRSVGGPDHMHDVAQRSTWRIEPSTPADGFECFYLFRDGVQVAEIDGYQTEIRKNHLNDLIAAANAAQPPAAPVETEADKGAEIEVLEQTVEHLISDMEKLKDPVAVHINMLRGTIAKPTWANIKHLYPEHFQCSADTAMEGRRDAIVQAIHKHVGIRQRVNVDLTGVEEAAGAILRIPVEPQALPVPVAWRSRQAGSKFWQVHVNDPTEAVEKYATVSYEIAPLFACSTCGGSGKVKSKNPERDKAWEVPCPSCSLPRPDRS